MAKDDSEPTGVAWMILSLIAYFMRFFFVGLPDWITHRLPMSDGMLAGGFLYIFLQAIGLLWLFSVMLVSGLLVNFVACSLSGCSLDASIWTLIPQMSSVWIHYCVLRFLIHVGANFWALGWESFSDFPTFRRLIAGPRSLLRDPSYNSPPSSRTESFDYFGEQTTPPFAGLGNDTRDMQHQPSGPHIPVASRKASEGIAMREAHSSHRKASWNMDCLPMGEARSTKSTFRGALDKLSRRYDPLHPVAVAAQKIVMVGPGVFLLVLHNSVVFSTIFCNSYDGWRKPVGDDAGLAWRWWIHGTAGFCQGPIPDFTGRLNSSIRFTIYAGYVQWIAASLRLFPSWHRALFINGHRLAIGSLFILAPFACLHILTFSPLLFGWERLDIIPMVPTQHQYYAIDNGMIALWMVWALTMDVSMLQPETLKVSGFDYEFMRGQRWSDFTVHLKCAFLGPVLLRFIWCCLFPGMGLAVAQFDFIMISLAYACMLMCVWVVCFIIVDFPRKKRMILVSTVTLGVAVGLSTVAQRSSVVIVFILWGHAMRTQLPWFGSTKRSTPVEDWKTTREHKYSMVVLRVSLLILLALVVVLFVLTVVSAIQDKAKWYPETIHLENYTSGTHVAHTVSHMYLQTTGQRSERQAGKYAICGQLYHGLSVLDYSLVALSAYWEPTSKDFLSMVEDFFPKRSDPPMSLKVVNNSRSKSQDRQALYWVEYESPELNTTIIGVRGTDPTKIGDFVEDIRLWTEPVAIQLLSFALPTVRLWPHGTIDRVITGSHSLLDFFGYSDSSWSYEGLLDHVEHLRDQGKKVLVTGHSMGGGLAMIISALAGVPAVAITPPGIYQSMSKHLHKRKRKMDKQCSAGGGASWTNADRSVHYESLTVLVENDWVNGIFDSHGGLVQTIECDRSDMGLQLQCHMIESTICHIHRHCGDHRLRWKACEHKYTLHSTIGDIIEMGAKGLGTQLGRVVAKMDLQRFAIPIFWLGLACLFLRYG